MTEPAASAATAGVVATTVGATAWITGLDPGAVFGAFAGAVTFAITSKDTSLVPRLVYALISLVVGYAAVPDLAGLSPIKEPLVIAFVASAVVVQTTITLIDRIRTMSVRAVWDALVSVFRKGG
ncbi:putative holin [Paracandidimonas soli]|uniref:Putative phage holin n=1 Tax=Paracandidimonas soli TaxID=1917182 RepID=A0A4R3USA0_9BURK|nr:putative holin [Paracandidimonas soli]TCU93741.1 putative phage holin [Paracandidimonas soli]TCV01920.1 putative phage holin [Paracandidimonas soli]